VSNFWDDQGDSDSDLVKRLRQEIKDRDKRLSDLDATLAERNGELDKLRPQVRLTTVRDVLGDLKVNPKVAKLIPPDVDPTKDAVTAWLAEYGDVLGIKQGETEEKPEAETPEETPGTPAVDPAVADQWARVQSQEASAGATAPDKEAQDLAQLTAAYQAALKEGGSDAFFAFLTGEKALPQ
jgi:hypothetical protein